MPRVFNTSGPCLAGKHYMIPPGRRLGQIRELIGGEHYFVIHAPRQTGKTTLLRSLSRSLTEEGNHAAVTVSLESFTSPSVAEMMPQILRNLEYAAEDQLAEDQRPPSRRRFIEDPYLSLKAFLKAWSAALDRPLVIFFDEADALPGEVLVSVLRQLRDGYTSRPAPFPHSIALVGVRDIRDRIAAGDGSAGNANPFNVSEGSLLLRNFIEDEVQELVSQHTEETGQQFEPDASAEIFRQTRGQPWLVNALASQLTTRYDALVKDRDRPVTRSQVIRAREILVERRDTHLDSLADKLREKRVQRVIEPLLVGDSGFDPAFDDDFVYTRDLGMVTRERGKIEIANPIYQEIIPRALSFHVQMGVADEPAWYVAEDGTLDIDKLIRGFIGFWRRHGEVLLKGMLYHEAAPHLVFMAYLQRIVNAGGQVEREFAIGTGRADLITEYGGQQDVIELKLHRGSYTLPDGLEQVAKYAKRLGREVAYLVIFDPKAVIPWEERGQVEETEHDGVKVFVLRA